jgi:hypothetical protein
MQNCLWLTANRFFGGFESAAERACPSCSFRIAGCPRSPGSSKANLLSQLQHSRGSTAGLVAAGGGGGGAEQYVTEA